MDSSETLIDIDIRISGSQDLVHNPLDQPDFVDFFSIDTESPEVASIMTNRTLISDPDTGMASFHIQVDFSEAMDTTVIPAILFPVENPLAQTLTLNGDSSKWLNSTIYLATYDVADANETLDSIDIRVELAVDIFQNPVETSDFPDEFSIDTENPFVVNVIANPVTVTDADVGSATFTMSFSFSEAMDTTQVPTVTFPVEDPLAFTLSPNPTASGWQSTTLFEAQYDVANSNEKLDSIDVRLAGLVDLAQNELDEFTEPDLFHIETENPTAISLSATQTIIADRDTGIATFRLRAMFSEAMDTLLQPVFTFPVEDPLAQTLAYNPDSSSWQNASLYEAAFDVSDANEKLDSIDVRIEMAVDIFQNPMETFDAPDWFHIDTENPDVTNILATPVIIADVDTGSGTFVLSFSFSEEMDTSFTPFCQLPG